MQPQRARANHSRWSQLGNGMPRLGRCPASNNARQHGSIVVERARSTGKMLNITAYEAGTEHALHQSV
jgi:hypothetical protein